MVKKHIIAVLLLLSVTFVSTAQVRSKPENIGHNRTLPPDNCLVIAKVVKVFSARNRVSKQQCKETPCIARIKIIEVKGYGSSFPVKFSKKQKIEVQFVHSLKQTDRGNLHLTELKRRDYFEAKKRVSIPV